MRTIAYIVANLVHEAYDHIRDMVHTIRGRHNRTLKPPQ